MLSSIAVPYLLVLAGLELAESCCQPCLLSGPGLPGRQNSVQAFEAKVLQNMLSNLRHRHQTLDTVQHAAWPIVASPTQLQFSPNRRLVISSSVL